MRGFWRDLQNVGAGDNALGVINVLGINDLQAELDYASNPPGLIMVKATALGGGVNGVRLDKVYVDEAGVASVYWLPWKNWEATTVYRNDFEGKEDCDFFMTTALTGCRFNLTPKTLVHVAHGVKANDTVRVPGTRRLSVSAGPEGDVQYGGALIGAYTRALIFGVKNHNGTWSYKVLDTHTNQWSIL